MLKYFQIFILRGGIEMYQENAWKKYSEESLDKLMKFNDEYKDFLSNSKT